MDLQLKQTDIAGKKCVEVTLVDGEKKYIVLKDLYSIVKSKEEILSAPLIPGGDDDLPLSLPFLPRDLFNIIPGGEDELDGINLNPDEEIGLAR